MSLHQLQSFFMWCTIINFGLLILSGILVASLQDFICKMQGKFYDLSPEKISQNLYLFIGIYKIMVIVFNFVPWIATLLIE